MTTETVSIQLAHPHLGQRQVLDCKARYVVVVCGRRWGKTETGKQAIVKAALEGKYCWWIQPSYGMATEVWLALKDTLRPLIAEKQENLYRMSLITGGVVQVKSGHTPEALRGFGLDLAVLDEAAFIEEQVWLGSIRPALTDKQGRAMFLSSPNGLNWFFRLYQRGLDPEYPDWESFHFTTAENPLIPAGEVEAAEREQPDRWYRQEYLAEFIEDAGSVFRGIDEACRIVPGAITPQSLENPMIVFGVDWGRSNDFTVIAVMDRQSKTLVHLERFRQMRWQLQQERLAELAAIWNPDIIWAESNAAGAPVIEALQDQGLPVQPFDTQATSKGPLIEALALAIERGDITLLDDPVLKGELRSYTLERMQSGRYRYGALPGEHDDTIIAVALAWHGSRYSGLGFS